MKKEYLATMMEEASDMQLDNNAEETPETPINELTISDADTETFVRFSPMEYSERITSEITEAGGPWVEPEEYRGSVGRTMFDTPSSEDDTVTVLLPKEHLVSVPSQSLVRINSAEDNRSYLGVVTKGPFAEPDGLRGDTPLIVTTTIKGGIFMPKYHGRIQVELLGEEVDGTLMPPRFRPRPNSPVFLSMALQS